jgi:hypothetical protein
VRDWRKRCDHAGGDSVTVYRGVVREGKVVLPDDIALPDGTPVEIREITPPPPGRDEADRLDRLEQALRASGLVREFKRPPYPAETGDRTPIRVEGKPLSEMIIEDRR